MEETATPHTSQEEKETATPHTSQEEEKEEKDHMVETDAGTKAPAYVKIGVYTFEVLQVVKFVELQRTFAQIRNKWTDVTTGKHHEANFACYRSESELGMWRFCTFDTGVEGGTISYSIEYNKNPVDSSAKELTHGFEGGKFFKGDDYVQATMIHLDLQDLINTIEIQELKRDTYLKDFPGNEDKRKSAVKKRKRYIISYDLNQMYLWTVVPNWKTLGDCTSTLSCVEEKKEVKLSDIVGVFMEASSSNFSTIIPEENFVGELPVKPDAEKQAIDIPIEHKSQLFRKSSMLSSSTSFESTLNDPSRRVEFKNQELENLALSMSCGTNSNSIYEKIKSFSDSFEEKFAKVDLYKAKTTHNVNFQNVLEAQYRFCGVTLENKNKTSDEKVILYYMEIEFVKSADPSTHPYGNTIRNIMAVRMHIMPIIMVPHNEQTHCTKWGLYSHYVNAGAYICKLFDYSMPDALQCSLDEAYFGKISDRYSYIGNRYWKNIIFPYNRIYTEAEQEEQVQPTSAYVTKKDDLNTAEELLLKSSLRSNNRVIFDKIKDSTYVYPGFKHMEKEEEAPQIKRKGAISGKGTKKKNKRKTRRKYKQTKRRK